ncbi:hypothetical protein [Yinghuangia sp. YIM S10712]|uniref:hypothetical protein n=1 Tax=Yinghuangia sp. YIM S10712 TaxID=3436930 RepID=UPI003F532FC0
MKAKVEQRERARTLRLQGKTYDEIVEELGVSKSSVSLWVRDLPKPREQSPEAMTRHMDMMRAVRDENVKQRVERNHRESADEFTHLSERELLALGVGLYWAEGTKSKPWRPAKRVDFVNSDPGMIRVFLAWLRSLGLGTDRCTFRVFIHETADVAAAERFWADVVGVPAEDFQPVVLKKHNPTTVRYNTAEAYRGCLNIRVRRSTELYECIEGWWAGIVEAASAHLS